LKKFYKTCGANALSRYQNRAAYDIQRYMFNQLIAVEINRAAAEMLKMLP